MKEKRVLYCYEIDKKDFFNIKVIKKDLNNFSLSDIIELYWEEIKIKEFQNNVLMEKKEKFIVILLKKELEKVKNKNKEEEMLNELIEKIWNANKFKWMWEVRILGENKYLFSGIDNFLFFSWNEEKWFKFWEKIFLFLIIKEKGLGFNEFILKINHNLSDGSYRKDEIKWERKFKTNEFQYKKEGKIKTYWEMRNRHCNLWTIYQRIFPDHRRKIY